MSAIPSAPTASAEAAPFIQFLEALGTDHTVLCAKAFRVELSCDLPLIPCLDHEAQLQGNPAPHISAYLEDRNGEFHEVGLIASEHRIVVDAPSTMAETSTAGRDAMVALLRQRFPEYSIVVKQPSWLRGDARVAQVIRSQLLLRDIMKGEETAEVRWSLEKIKAISDLMEKESRVFSWGTRTMTPALGGTGVAMYLFIGLFRSDLTPHELGLLRSVTVAILTGAFLYFGLKAVYLTGLGTRVWKRATEYKLILDARKRHKAKVRPPAAPAGRVAETAG